MDAKSIIENKRNKKELTSEEIRHLISKYNKGDILEVQVAAIITLMYTNGITENEIIELTKAISETGKIINLSEISNDIIDIHSIGGINDKVSIILTCAISSLGIPTAKVSGRELGLSDKMKTIPGYNANIEIEKFKEIINQAGIGIIGEPNELAPVENKIYRIRNLIACMDSIPLTAIGIMGTKIALGANNIMFDISFGDSTYIKTKEDAKRLAKMFIQIGKYFNKTVKCIITDYNEPLGYNFGNISEIEEVVNCLKGNMTEDIKELVLEIGDKYMSFLDTGKNSVENKKMILETIKNGNAYEKFLELVSIQGGDTSTIDNLNEIGKTKIVIPVFAETDGYIKKVDIDMVRSIAIYLNAIRVSKDNKIDVGSGIVLNKKIGDKVQVGEILAYIHTNDESKVKGAVENLKDAFIVSKKSVEVKDKVIDFIE